MLNNKSQYTTDWIHESVDNCQELQIFRQKKMIVIL
jgi:hypothetical protein